MTGKKPKTTIRIQAEISRHTRDLLMEQENLMGASSYAEVIRRNCEIIDTLRKAYKTGENPDVRFVLQSHFPDL